MGGILGVSGGGGAVKRSHVSGRSPEEAGSTPRCR